MPPEPPSPSGRPNVVVGFGPELGTSARQGSPSASTSYEEDTRLNLSPRLQPCAAYGVSADVWTKPGRHSMLSEALTRKKEAAPAEETVRVLNSTGALPRAGDLLLPGSSGPPQCPSLGGIFSRQPVPSFRSLCDDGVMPEESSGHSSGPSDTGSQLPSSREGGTSNTLRESTLQLV